MSCDWDILCRTCDSRHGFSDANHCDDVMRHLIRHREAIAALAPLLRDAPESVEFKLYYGSIDAAWFAKHTGHDLVPIDEYGGVDPTAPPDPHKATLAELHEIAARVIDQEERAKLFSALRELQERRKS